MSRIPPLADEDLADLQEVIAPAAERMGFMPASQRVMGYSPPLLRAFAQLSRTIWRADARISMPLRNMVGYMASHAAGCMYCIAHTGSNAARAGVDEAKIAAIWEYETSDLFTEAERAALRFAQCAAAMPNAVTDEVFEDLAKHFDREEIIEMLGVVAYYGFLNRWNDSLATALEELPGEFAGRTLAGTGWSVGKHVERGHDKDAAE